MDVASKRRFEDFYALGKSVAKGTESEVHKCYAVDDEQLVRDIGLRVEGIHREFAVNSVNSQSYFDSAPSPHSIKDDDDGKDNEI